MKANNICLKNWTISFVCSVIAMLMAPAMLTAQDEEELPPPEEVRLETKDGIALSATFYPGTKDKESVPVILLHAWEENRNTMVNIAGALQQQYGFATIVPDLRGHGKSDKTSSGEALKPERWRADELATMIEDIEACKNFLINKNNAGELNIDMLSVVADGESTILATLWTLRDWSYAPLGSRKQGQDVKALILLNPSRNFKGLNGNDAYQNDLFTGKSGAAFPVLIGATRDHRRDARNIYDRMERGRKTLDIANKAIDYHNFEIEQQRRIRKSRRDGDVPMSTLIGDFVQQQVFDRRHDFRWAERKSN